MIDTQQALTPSTILHTDVTNHTYVPKSTKHQLKISEYHRNTKVEHCSSIDARDTQKQISRNDTKSFRTLRRKSNSLIDKVINRTVLLWYCDPNSTVFPAIQCIQLWIFDKQFPNNMESDLLKMLDIQYLVCWKDGQNSFRKLFLRTKEIVELDQKLFTIINVRPLYNSGDHFFLVSGRWVVAQHFGAT